MTTASGGTPVRGAWSAAARVVAVVGLWLWCVVSGWAVMFAGVMSTTGCDTQGGFQCESAAFEHLVLWLPILGGLLAGGVGTWGALSHGRRRWPWLFVGVALSTVPAIVMSHLIDT